MYSPVQSNKIFAQIAEQIEQQILRGDLSTGDRLPTERELAERFQASRTAVREAMKTLAQKGLVDMRPGRGTIVINHTPQALRDTLGLLMRVGSGVNSNAVVEAREIFEPEIAALAAERADETDISALQDAVAIMDLNLENANVFIDADNIFHRALARAAGNPIIMSLIDSIVDLLSEQRKQIFTVDGASARGQVHHRQLLQAICNHDTEAARQAMRAHLKQVRADVAAAADTTNIP
jgi:GntR family transcriptional regulator, transcriptional repressor for pyruvate dehydrogenase complex